MSEPIHSQLSRREKQIMDIIFELGEATAVDVQQRLPDPPSNSSIRVLLRILEEKGHLAHRRDGARFIYTPTVSPEKAKRSALSHLVKTFFGGSAPRVVATLLSTQDLTNEELEELSHLIEQAHKDEASEQREDDE